MTRNTVKSIAKEVAKEILKKDQSKATVKDAFEYYFRTKTVSPATRDGKNSLYTQLEDKGYLDKPIKDMNGAAIREFIGQFKLMPSSAHSLYSRLIAVLGHYVREHNLTLEIPKGLIKNSKRKETETHEYLIWAELQILINTALESKNEQFYLDLFCLMALSGMAVGDLLRFEPRFSVIGNWITYTRQKTGSECVIPLLPQAKKIIERYSWPCKISKRSIQYKCEHVISRLVGRKIKSHGARKTAGCIFLELGMSMESVSKILGHSSPSITAKVYAKVTEAKIQRELDNLPIAIKEMMNS